MSRRRRTRSGRCADTTSLLPFLLALAACGTAKADRGDLEFDVRRIDVGVSTASALILDVDGDDVPEVIVSGGGRVVVLERDGARGLRIRETVEAGEHPVDLAAGDLNGDRRTDLVVANHETSYVTLLFGGPRGFDSGDRERLEIDVSPHPHAVAVADLDEDGHLDLLVDDRDRERLLVYRGAGDGTFEVGPPVPVGGDPYRGMILHDLDGDGHLDVITPNPRAVAVQFGNGDGTFRPGPRLASAGLRPFSVAAGDFDGDGSLDLAAGSGEGRGAVALWRGTGGGTFEPAAGSPYAIASGPTALATSDLDGDGVDDLLVTSYVGDELAVLLGGEQGFRVHRIELEDHPWGAAAGDLDGDGRTDIVTANDGGPRISLLLARGR